ncbi:hypothetical protein [Frankia sp. BMG5.23]|uniref:hypothetical protein n=1 Tax=Frankia sp. BMG5.23 TaxID=683305 RepID=UPI000460BEFA|nr:hypothetical protein [Frankia sp. BMG5.23]KDA44969.1 hypothetical protein BMG523Draft_00094 [Frankia sp. BMG5.23]
MTGICEVDGCTAPAVVVIADRTGDRLTVCPDCHHDALRRSGGLIRGVALTPTTNPRAEGGGRR